jgi:hypothetical protein
MRGAANIREDEPNARRWSAASTRANDNATASMQAREQAAGVSGRPV